MPRIVKRARSEPYKLSIGGEDRFICQCGLSKNQPFCDGSHKIAKSEEANRLYWYDESGNRHEYAGDFPGIRAY